MPQKQTQETPAEDEKTPEELANRRTKLAEDRNIMAMERTFAGWMRTSFAAIGVGLAFHAVFGELQPPWLGRAVASLFLAAGGMLAIYAQRRACQSMAELHAHKLQKPSMPNFRLLGYAVATGAALLVTGLWLSGAGR